MKQKRTKFTQIKCNKTYEKERETESEIKSTDLKNWHSNIKHLKVMLPTETYWNSQIYWNSNHLCVCPCFHSIAIRIIASVIYFIYFVWCACERKRENHFVCLKMLFLFLLWFLLWLLDHPNSRFYNSVSRKLDYIGKYPKFNSQIKRRLLLHSKNHLRITHTHTWNQGINIILWQQK